MKNFFLTIVALMGISVVATAQIKIGSNPKVIGTNSNLEVEAINGKKVRVAKDIGTLFVENVPAAASTGADSVLLQSTSGEVHQMSVARFAAMMKANGVGLPAGGTTGQVLTQTATGTPTWQDPATTGATVTTEGTLNVLDVSTLKVGECAFIPFYNKTGGWVMKGGLNHGYVASLRGIGLSNGIVWGTNKTQTYPVALTTKPYFYIDAFFAIDGNATYGGELWSAMTIDSNTATNMGVSNEKILGGGIRHDITVVTNICRSY